MKELTKWQNGMFRVTLKEKAIFYDFLCESKAKNKIFGATKTAKNRCHDKINEVN